MWSDALNILLAPKYADLDETEVLAALESGGEVAKEVTRLTMHYLIIYQDYIRKNGYVPPEIVFAAANSPVEKIAVRRMVQLARSRAS